MLRASLSRVSRAAAIQRAAGDVARSEAGGKMPGRGRKQPLARLPVPGLSAFRFPTRLLAKAVQATVHFLQAWRFVKNY